MNTNTRELILLKWKRMAFNDIRVHSRSFVVEDEGDNQPDIRVHSRSFAVEEGDAP